MLRQLQRWLHQHLFKVGWLVTKSFHTTTILYYTFFLPGVVIYELTVWLVAGVLNVRAERALHWPEPQEIGELRLNFVQLARRTSQWKHGLIKLSPLVSGMILIWLIGINVLGIPEVVRTLSADGLPGISRSVRQLTQTTDFWLWAYMVFTIGNTMLPAGDILKNWQRVLVAAVLLIAVPLIFLGMAEQVIGSLASGPLATLLNVMIAVFIIVIAFDLLGVAVLAIIENTIEYVTGDSATFKNGKMIVMTREEAIAQRKRERELARRRERRVPATQPAGPPTIYNLPFPIPGPPGQEPVTSIRTAIVEPEVPPGLPPARREEPTIITAASRRADAAAEQDGIEDRFSKQTERERPTERPFRRFTTSGEDQAHVNENVAPDDVDEDEIESSRGALRPRPSPFARMTDEAEDDEEEEIGKRAPERGAQPYASRQLRPTSFSAGSQEPDDTEDGDDEETVSGRGTFSGATRPSLFSSSGLRSGTEADERQDRGNQASSPRKAQSRFQPRSPSTSPIGSRSSSFAGLGSATGLGASSPSGDEEDEDNEDEDDIFYEDAEDSV